MYKYTINLFNKCVMKNKVSYLFGSKFEANNRFGFITISIRFGLRFELNNHFGDLWDFYLDRFGMRFGRLMCEPGNHFDG